MTRTTPKKKHNHYPKTLVNKIIIQPIDWFKPYEKNARTHSESQLDEIAASISQFGFVNPIIAAADGTIIAGHGRHMAAKTRLEMKEAPAIILDHLSDNERRALVIADNKIAANAGWDYDILSSELNDLHKALDADEFDLTITGFDQIELEDYILDDSDPPANEEEEEEEEGAIEIPEKAITIEGDVWLLGRHRLICGDSTKDQTVEAVLLKDKIDLVFTDPPYGMSYGGGRAEGKHSLDKKTGQVKIKAHGMIINDDLEGEKLIALVHKSLRAAKSQAKKNTAFYVCFTWRTYSEFEQGLKHAGLSIKNCIVWDKGSIGLGNSHYRPQHEFIFYSGGEWCGDKAESDVWRFSRGHTGEYVHPTQKPVELVERALVNSSRRGDVVFDCFGGSGSTLIACEKLGRKARTIDLDPKYCDAIILRWQKYTGEKAVLEQENKTFSDMRKIRHG